MEKLMMHFKTLLLCIATISAAPLQLNFLQTLQSFQNQTLQGSSTELAKTTRKNVPEDPIQLNFQKIAKITSQDDNNVLQDSKDLIFEDPNQESLPEMNLNQEDSGKMHTNQESSREMKQMPYEIQQQNMPFLLSRNIQESPMYQNQVQHQMFTPQYVISQEPSTQSVTHDMLNPIQHQVLLPQNLLLNHIPSMGPINQEMFNQMQHEMLTPQNVLINQEQAQLMNQETLNPNHYQMVIPQEYQDPIRNQEMLIPMLDISLINQIAMQQQILALHRLQALQNLNAMNMIHQQPLLVFLPTDPKNTEENVDEAPNKIDTSSDNSGTNSDNKADADKNSDPESVIIESAYPEKYEMEAMNTPNTMLIFPNPNARFSIGEIISGISWLPIEINVPDTIAWAYNGISNGISGIWSIIGQWPFRRPTPVIQMKINPHMNMYLKQMTYQGQQPMVMALPNNAQFAQRPLILP